MCILYLRIYVHLAGGRKRNRNETFNPTTKYEGDKGTWINAANPPTTTGIAIDGITIQYTSIYVLLAVAAAIECVPSLVNTQWAGGQSIEPDDTVFYEEEGYIFATAVHHRQIHVVVEHPTSAIQLYGSTYIISNLLLSLEGTYCQFLQKKVSMR